MKAVENVNATGWVGESREDPILVQQDKLLPVIQRFWILGSLSRC